MQIGREGRKKQVCFWWPLRIPPTGLEMLHSAATLCLSLSFLDTQLRTSAVFLLLKGEEKVGTSQKTQKGPLKVRK